VTPNLTSHDFYKTQFNSENWPSFIGHRNASAASAAASVAMNQGISAADMQASGLMATIYTTCKIRPDEKGESTHIE